MYADRADLGIQMVGAWSTLGMRGTESIGMMIKGEVPAGNVIGADGQFPEIAREDMIPMSHLGWAAVWLGAALGAFSVLVR